MTIDKGRHMFRDRHPAPAPTPDDGPDPGPLPAGPDTTATDRGRALYHRARAGDAAALHAHIEFARAQPAEPDT